MLITYNLSGYFFTSSYRQRWKHCQKKHFKFSRVILEAIFYTRQDNGQNDILT